MKQLNHYVLKGLTTLLFMLCAVNCIAQATSSNSIEKGGVPLSKSYHMFALMNGWKTYNDKTGYTISLPSNINDNGKTQSDIHYYGDFEITVNIDCYSTGVDLQKELNNSYKQFQDVGKDRTMVSQTLSAVEFLIVSKDKDGSTWYMKCIKGVHCLYTLSFGVGNDHPIKERDVQALLNLFRTTGK